MIESQDSAPPLVLLVEDSKADAKLVCQVLERVGSYRVEHCTTLAEALERLAAAGRPRPDVILLDLNLPDSSAVETYERLAEAGPPPVVVVSGIDDPACARQLIERGAQDYLVKGDTSAAGLSRALRQAIDRAHLLDELAGARDQAMAAAEAQKAFVAAMSHEIRTPLNAILGVADLLARTRLDAAQQQYVAIFRRCGRALKGLLDTALDLSRLEAGDLKLQDEFFELETLVDECLEAFAFAAHRKGVAIIGDVADTVRGTARGDDARLRQVLMNLLGNAVKFTERGRVVVRVRPGENGISIEVEDTGVGIPPERQEAIFERFVQAESDTLRRFGGNGLGLALSREIAEAMGGTLSVASVPGQGSCFRFDVPLRVDRRPSRAEAEGQRALVVMSDPVERGVLARRLRERGAEVLEAGTTEEGRSALAASSFTALVVDARLPEGGGLEVFESSEAPAAESARRVVLLPMDHRVGDQARFEAICAAPLCKPIRWDELDSALRGEPHHRGDERREATPAPLFPNARVLLVEDSPDNRTVALAHLAGTGCQVEVAVDGAEAMARFEPGRFDVILMDVHMPRMDGYEAARRIRELEAFREADRTPIIALTADSLPEQRAALHEAGCDSHLSKPFDREGLYRELRRYVRVGSNRSDDGRVPSPEVAFDMTYDIPDDLADLAEDYLARRRADAESLRSAARAGSFDETRRLGHNMKGSGGGYGFARVSELGAEIQQASEGRDPEEIERLAGELDEYARKVLLELAGA